MLSTDRAIALEHWLAVACVKLPRPGYKDKNGL